MRCMFVKHLGPFEQNNNKKRWFETRFAYCVICKDNSAHHVFSHLKFTCELLIKIVANSIHGGLKA